MKVPHCYSVNTSLEKAISLLPQQHQPSKLMTRTEHMSGPDNSCELHLIICNTDYKRHMSQILKLHLFISSEVILTFFFFLQAVFSASLHKIASF